MTDLADANATIEILDEEIDRLRAEVGRLKDGLKQVAGDCVERKAELEATIEALRDWQRRALPFIKNLSYTYNATAGGGIGNRRIAGKVLEKLIAEAGQTES